MEPRRGQQGKSVGEAACYCLQGARRFYVCLAGEHMRWHPYAHMVVPLPV
jgi:hypothetical protein